MPVSEMLTKFRKGGYGEKPEKEEAKGPRMIKLTDDEAKELQGYSEGEGMEQECLVRGRLNGTDFSVTSVSSPGSEEDEMSKQMMEGSIGGPALVQNQTMPSPS